MEKTVVVSDAHQGRKKEGEESVAERFYRESLEILKESGLPFMAAGTFAYSAYTGIARPTKDMDLFCKAGDYPKILTLFAQKGFKTEVEDDRWIAKVKRGRYFFDLIFGSMNAIVPINDDWMKSAVTTRLYGVEVPVVPVTELIWSKIFIQDRHRYDGNDIAHLILKQGERIDWKRLLGYMELYWEVLLICLLNFRFVYPSERERVPRWLLDELLDRLKAQVDLPTPQVKACRGTLYSRYDYQTDVKEWGYADLLESVK